MKKKMTKICHDKKNLLGFANEQHFDTAYILPFRQYIPNADMNELSEMPA